MKFCGYISIGHKGDNNGNISNRWVMLPCLRKISDPTSGLFMFRREVIENADLQPIGWKIMVEVLAMGTYSKVVEIPYKFPDYH